MLEGTSGVVLKYFILDEGENTAHKNLWDTTKAVLE